MVKNAILHVHKCRLISINKRQKGKKYVGELCELCELFFSFNSLNSPNSPTEKDIADRKSR